jgi:hypothetical protein
MDTTHDNFLVFSESEWKLYRGSNLGFDFTDEQIEIAKTNRGFLGYRNNIGCYLSTPIIATSCK